jgi:hypothetical protein
VVEVVEHFKMVMVEVVVEEQVDFELVHHYQFVEQHLIQLQ